MKRTSRITFKWGFKYSVALYPSASNEPSARSYVMQNNRIKNVLFHYYFRVFVTWVFLHFHFHSTCAHPGSFADGSY